MSQRLSFLEQRRRVSRPLLLITILAVTACTTPQERVSQKEDHLAAAGFDVRPADTSQRQAMLNRLPSRQFVLRKHGGTVNYVYADPLVCDCLYVGSQQAYDNYARYLQQKESLSQQETTAQLYSDGAWNWGAWGPWGPSYGFSPGFGW